LADPAVIVRPEALHAFMLALFSKQGLPAEDARTVADVLLAADLRGVDSHGVSRIFYYVMKLQAGTINKTPELRVLSDAPACALLDGDNGMGPVVGKRAMALAIEKAKTQGIGFVAVRRSNHYGIAGYYAMMALEQDMIGVTGTNSVCMVAPTFGTEQMYGTNPLSVACPTAEEEPWVLDMATSSAPFGKLELAMRTGSKVPSGWVQDKDGRPSDDPAAPMGDGALTPLGATPEMSSHKGYGLAVLIDILSGVLSGALWGPQQEGLTRMRMEPSDVGHFFAALRIDPFRPVAEFKSTLDDMLRGLRASRKAEGHERIYVHGEKEREEEARRRAHGIPLHAFVKGVIESQAATHSVALPW
jgi:L-2-hydroxycarboxylate dehydrogenase (NAD+)